jgi:hypothetical protein
MQEEAESPNTPAVIKEMKFIKTYTQRKLQVPWLS